MDDLKKVCPNCKSERCVYGKLDNVDSDYFYTGLFRPLNINDTFWKLREPEVDVSEKHKFWACADCGHLWNKVDVEQLNEVLNDCNWDGKNQLPPEQVR